MRSFALVIGLLLLLAVEILRVYFIMPFPGSQQANTIDIAYWIDRNIVWLRLLLLVVILFPVLAVFRGRSRWRKVLLSVGLGIYGLVFFLFNFKFLAEKMFYQPKVLNFSSVRENVIGMDKLVVGIEIGGQARAYPIQLIGYHHQVRDTVGGQPVMVTYCTVCRTGRVFSPVVEGHTESFRLVGMDHFNAMFEDATTKSWWRQVSGEAIAGPMKGHALQELPSRQMTLAAWVRMYPGSSVMQPDPGFKKEYDDMAKFDKGASKGNLTRRDSSSWQRKSWIVGIVVGHESKAYDWNELVSQRLISDSVAGKPLMVVLEKDTATFHVWSREVNGAVLRFERVADTAALLLPGHEPETGTGTAGWIRDLETGSLWNMNGECEAGKLQGARLQPVRAYQEFWHSWETFHPATKRSGS